MNKDIFIIGKEEDYEGLTEEEIKVIERERYLSTLDDNELKIIQECNEESLDEEFRWYLDNLTEEELFECYRVDTYCLDEDFHCQRIVGPGCRYGIVFPEETTKEELEELLRNFFKQRKAAPHTVLTQEVLYRCTKSEAAKYVDQIPVGFSKDIEDILAYRHSKDLYSAKQKEKELIGVAYTYEELERQLERQLEGQLMMKCK